MMTPRERWLAAIHLEPVDRFPFWPKVDAAYLKAQAAPYQTMTVGQFHRWLGSDPHVWTPTLVHEMRGSTRLETATEGVMQKLTYHTPHGAVSGVQQYDAATQAWVPRTYPVRDCDGLKIMKAYYEDAVTKLDRAAFEKTKEFVAAIGNNAITAPAVGTSPFMELVQGLAGLEKTNELLAECPSEVGELLQIMHQQMVKRMEYCCSQSPADLLYLIEHTSTTQMTAEQYRQFCLPLVREYALMAQKARRPLVLHMSGHLKALLPELKMLPVAAIEAFTTPPVGDATLVDGRAACPKTCLIGGANASLWARPMLEIIVDLDEQFEALPHLRGLVITSGGVLPPSTDPKKLRDVAMWVQGYPMK